MLDAGSTPSTPLPVPWLAGCGSKSVLAAFGLANSALAGFPLLVAALATTAFDVSGTSGRAADIALVIGVPGWAGPAEASFSCPALTCTVLTLTGFIGSDEPGMAVRACDGITPLVNGAGSALGTEAAAAAKIDRDTGAGERAGAATGSGEVDAT